MRKEKENNVLTVENEVRINKEVILEKGDRIQVIKESSNWHISYKFPEGPALLLDAGSDDINTTTAIFYDADDSCFFIMTIDDEYPDNYTETEILNIFGRLGLKRSDLSNLISLY